MAKPPTVLHLRRKRFSGALGGDTCFVNVSYDGGLTKIITRVGPGRFPEFDGEEAWFKTVVHSKQRMEFLEQVADKRGTPLKGPAEQT